MLRRGLPQLPRAPPEGCNSADAPARPAAAAPRSARELFAFPSAVTLLRPEVRCALETLTTGEQNSKEERLDLVVLVSIFTWTGAHHRHTDKQAAFRPA
eukprot:scaffold126734_cov60-Phaeocystis_antarctica.AAC.2